MNRKSAATLLLISLMLCLLASSYLGGATTSNSQRPDGGSAQHVDPVTGGDFYQRSPGLSDGNVSLVNLWVNRTMKVGENGLVTVIDQAEIKNNDTMAGSSWTFYLPSDVYPKLRYLVAYANVTKLNVVTGEPYLSYFGVQVEFGNVGGLPANSSLVVKITQEYVGIVKPVVANQTLSLYFYRYLVSPYVTLKHNTTVVMPSTGSGGLALQAEKPISPFNCSTLVDTSNGAWVYTLPTQVAEVLSIDRRVEIGVTGYLSTTETHSVKNLGPLNMGSLRVVLPLSYIDGTLLAWDSSGNVGTRLDGRNVTVLFRNGLPLQVNWTYTYHISYKTSMDDYRTSEGGLDVIRMESATVCDCAVDSERVVVVFPSQTSLSSMSLNADQVQVQDGKLTLTYTFENVTPMNSPPFEFKYSLSLAANYERPILISLGFFILGFVYVGARKLMPREKAAGVAREEEKSRELRGLIKQFTSDYDEKTSLTLELEKLSEDRRKGKISKREYVERLNVGKRRVGSLTNAVNQEKQKLSLVNKRYAGMIRQLDTYEEERENAKASLENLEFRRRQGKATGDVYSRLKHENTRKIEKATSNIDSIVMQFRQETL